MRANEIKMDTLIDEIGELFMKKDANYIEMLSVIGEVCLLIVQPTNEKEFQNDYDILMYKYLGKQKEEPNDSA